MPGTGSQDLAMTGALDGSYRDSVTSPCSEAWVAVGSMRDENSTPVGDFRLAPDDVQIDFGAGVGTVSLEVRAFRCWLHGGTGEFRFEIDWQMKSGTDQFEGTRGIGSVTGEIRTSAAANSPGTVTARFTGSLDPP